MAAERPGGVHCRAEQRSRHSPESRTPRSSATPTRSSCTPPGAQASQKSPPSRRGRICRYDIFKHLLIGTVDPVAYALVMDALTHSGPAVPSRVADSSVPGLPTWHRPVQRADYIQMLSALPNILFVPVPFANLVGAPELAAEPALKCYVFAAGCPWTACWPGSPAMRRWRSYVLGERLQLGQRGTDLALQGDALLDNGVGGSGDRRVRQGLSPRRWRRRSARPIPLAAECPPRRSARNSLRPLNGSPPRRSRTRW